jgi:hypothetical protein
MFAHERVGVFQDYDLVLLCFWFVGCCLVFVRYSEYQSYHQMSVKLFVDLGSQPSRAVHWLLLLLKAPFELKTLRLDKGETRTPELSFRFVCCAIVILFSTDIWQSIHLAKFRRLFTTGFRLLKATPFWFISVLNSTLRGRCIPNSRLIERESMRIFTGIMSFVLRVQDGFNRSSFRREKI